MYNDIDHFDSPFYDRFLKVATVTAVLFFDLISTSCVDHNNAFYYCRLHLTVKRNSHTFHSFFSSETLHKTMSSHGYFRNLIKRPFFYYFCQYFLTLTMIWYTYIVLLCTKKYSMSPDSSLPSGSIVVRISLRVT